MITVREYGLGVSNKHQVRYSSVSRSQQQSLHQSVNTRHQDQPQHQRLTLQGKNAGVKQRAYSISKDNKENAHVFGRVEEKGISTIPLVYKRLETDECLKQFLIEIHPLVQLHKNLLYNQWMLFTNYKTQIRQLIQEVWKNQKEEHSNMLLAIQTFHIMKKLLRYLDLDEESVSKLIHINAKNLTQTKSEQLMEQVFISPNFFITSEMQERYEMGVIMMVSSNLMEMVQLMKQVVELTVKSEEHFRQLFNRFSKEEAGGIFKQLTNGSNYLYPHHLVTALQQHLNMQKLKADYCLHFLYKFGNCMQADMQQFKSQFRSKA